ncbi:MAG TPA: hypothetical protein VGH38_20365, partial [Bryobacteraceae bacterium]
MSGVRRAPREAGFWAAILLLLGGVGVAHASKDAQLPDWVVQASTNAPLKGEWRDAKAVFLLEDTLLTVQPDGRAVERYRAVVKILRPQGRDYARPIAAFSKDEKLDSFHV